MIFRLILLLGFPGFLAALGAAEPGAALPIVHLGLSRRLFDNVNENDARALLQLNLRALGASVGLDIRLAPGFFTTPAAIDRALATGQIDLIGLPSDEFVQLQPGLLRPSVVAGQAANTSFDEYLLIVRRDAPFPDIDALAGGRVHLQQSVKAPLSTAWLDVLCERAGHGPAHEFFATVQTVVKPSQVVLPVYFRQADAAVVTRRSFELLTELNPGIARDLHAIAVSPPLVSAVLGFRAGLSEALVDTLLETTRRITDNIAGRQAFTMFQIDTVGLIPAEALDSTRALCAEHAELALRRATAAQPVLP